MATEELTQGLEIDQDAETKALQAERDRIEAENTRIANAKLELVIPRMFAPQRIQLALANGDKFYIDPFPGLYNPGDVPADFDEANPLADAGNYGTLVKASIAAADKALAKMQDINRDADRSRTGKANAIRPIAISLIQSLAANYETVMLMREASRKKEVDFYTVPVLGASEGGTAAVDREIRDWFFGIEKDEVRDVELSRLATDPTGERVLIALMRSPVPMHAGVMAAIFDTWKVGRRNLRPLTAVKIDQELAAAEWALNAIRMATAAITNAAQIDGSQALRMVLEGDERFRGGAPLFGTPERIARTQMMLDNERQRAA